MFDSKKKKKLHIFIFKFLRLIKYPSKGNYTANNV